MSKKYAGMLGEKQIIKDQSLLRYEAIKQKIQVLPELRDLIPPLQEEESKQLEQNLLAEGCREALMVWETSQSVIDGSASDEAVYILVDGHNRYSICKKHHLDFKIHILSFISLKEVREFMIDNQLGRRNLMPEQAAYLRGLRYNNEKLEKGKYNRDEHKGQNVPYDSEGKKESTSERLAKQYNVSEKTIKRDAEFADGIDRLAPSLKKDILGGKIKVKKSDIQLLGQIPVDEPISSMDDVTTLLSPRVSTLTVEPLVKNTTEVNTLKKRIKNLVSQIDATNDIELCNELISCTIELKNLLT
ncbi:hypothetical protein SAMN04515674_106119 [Pseudarcicella hirudinis]|uniref:ParB-like nuclease domain-containing protein n=1 Tax=Pseudarcicella hirudinis TaxID=1079859 RepID=A0A1I5TN06_9BACT|nr:hypothetical protein [Pseudarcicella hirudinis]SFP84368.1 hypothetical protein SAMN04515674_106119 [Pseudarcicella hirudinis]